MIINAAYFDATFLKDFSSAGILNAFSCNIKLSSFTIILAFWQQNGIKKMQSKKKPSSTEHDMQSIKSYKLGSWNLV